MRRGGGGGGGGGDGGEGCFKCGGSGHYARSGTLSIQGTRRYSPIRGLTYRSCRGLRPMAEAIFALWAKKWFLCCFCLF